jgi:ABC-2 type transport system ATP-binding protein
MNAIETVGLSKVFHSRKTGKVDALKNLSLSIGTGEVFGFLGPNGAGKSTTIKILMGLIRPTSGSAMIAGQDISLSDSRANVGYLPENPAFYDFLTAEEYLRFVGRSFRMSDTAICSVSENVLKLLELWESRKRLIRSYSKGMVQRVGLAQVLLHDPEVYILDEPMSGLDPLGRSLVKEIIVDLKRRGKTVFFSTHITADVESVCDRVGVIVKGEMRCVRKVDEITVDGITGYEVRHLPEGSDVPEIAQLSKDELSAGMSELQASGSQILVVEPVRKNLEEFFVDIVRQE